MKNRITKVLALLLIAAGLIATSGCDVNVPEINYTVSFYMNGHGNQIESQTVKEGENAVRPADPVEEGQVFGGWFTDSECSGTEFDFGTAIKSDIQLFAKWTAKGPASYTVTFDANGGSGSMDAQVFTEGVAGVLKSCSFTAPDGMVFAGWMLSGDGEVKYADGASYTASSDVTLYAKWINKTYTVSFNSNGGSGTMEPQIFIEGVSANLNNCTFTAPEGKVFAGWAESADGEVKYVNGASYTASANVTLFAKWINNYLCFTAGTGGATVSMAKEGDGWNIPEVQYSTDRVTWSDFTIGTTSVTLNVGDKVYFKGNNPNGFNNSMMDYVKFVLAGSVAASGNVMSLVDTDCKTTTIPNNYCFVYLFYDCTTLTAAPELPATTLADDCYSNMFNGCRSLTAAPELKATSLAVSCYFNMFSGCESLTAAPALPTTTLAESCYSYMFSGCESLTAAPALSATTLADYCYCGMFSSCTSLTAAPALPATTLAEDCYSYMFSDCTSLTAAPELPATTLAQNCYYWMFNGCTSLTTASELPATTLAKYCYYKMFEGCELLTAAPELPATTLAEYCYTNMFSGCTKLSSLNVSFTAWHENATSGWLKDAGYDGSGTKTFTCPASLGTSTRDEDHIPYGWTIIAK